MKNILLCGFFVMWCHQAIGYTGNVLGTFTNSPMRDIYSTRANTLSDDADDLQKQLDNEAKDRTKFGRPKDLWILHFPHISGFRGIDNLKLPWNYKVNKKCISNENCTFNGNGTCECTKTVDWTSSTEKIDRANNNMVKVAKKEVVEIQANQVSSIVLLAAVRVVWLYLKNYRLDCNDIVDWNYKNQKDWKTLFPACGGVYQSPVDLPYSGMIRTKRFRQITFKNYDTVPKSMSLVHDGKTGFRKQMAKMEPLLIRHMRSPSGISQLFYLGWKLIGPHGWILAVTLLGEWPASQRPMIYGGAAYSRRYLFHSLAVRWPSEHKVGGLCYPMETQAIHISAEYATLDEAMKAAPKDKLSVLTLANIYMFANHNHKGLEELIKGFMSTSFGSTSITAHPLNVFNPPLREYVAYYGSMTTPPCTESVLWLVRARSLPITRALAEVLTDHLIASAPEQIFFRSPQPVNDRKIYFFD